VLIPTKLAALGLEFKMRRLLAQVALDRHQRCL